jgi:hypothetical protein
VSKSDVHEYVVRPIKEPLLVRMRGAGVEREHGGTMPLTPLRSHSGRAARSEQLAPDNYITDGHRLFRVVSQFAADERHRFASLENCLTLEVQAYSPGELAAMKLRPVLVTSGR